jgi:hypothetical protein
VALWILDIDSKTILKSHLAWSISQNWLVNTTIQCGTLHMINTIQRKMFCFWTCNHNNFLGDFYLQSAACVLVPGGFGDRGVRGMMLAAKYARENNVPYLGICLGMQISVIEFARSVSNFLFMWYLIFLQLYAFLSNSTFILRFWVGKEQTV